jgi:hypothetical protein
MAREFTIQVRYRPNHSTKVHFAGGNTVCLTPAGHTDPLCSDPQIINRVE